MVFKATFGISNLFTRILPGTIALATITVTELFVKAVRTGGDVPETTFKFDMLFSLDSLTVILLAALLLGELIHLFSENIGSTPSYFRRISYEKYENRSMLTVLQRRKMMKREASDDFESGKDTSGVTLVQKAYFFVVEVKNKIPLFSAFPDCIRSIVLSCIGKLQKFVQTAWNLICPDWLPSDEEINDITKDDITKIFSLIKEENKELSDVNHPGRLYMALLYEAKDFESKRTKELRIRYQAFRNSKFTIYGSLFLIPLSILYSGIVGDNLSLAAVLAVVFLIFVPYIVIIIHQIGIITNVEQQYVESLITEYIIENS